MIQLIQHQYHQILTVALLTPVLSLILRPVALKLSLVDRPNYRKNHDNDTAPIGGLCIFIACGLTILIFDDPQLQTLTPMIVAASLFLFLGLLDDQFDIKAGSKLLGQATICLVFLVTTETQVSSFGNFLWGGHIFDLGFLSLPFTLLAIIGLTNAFNMIDGSDGLAASLAVLTFLALLGFGSSHLELSLQKFLLMLVPSVITFLFFNFTNNKKFKLFLGDGGSLFLGFVVSVSLVKFAIGNETYNASIVLWFVAIPVYDFCAVVARRRLLKRKIMSADRSHIHHYFLSLGLSHFHVVTVILLMAVALLGVGIFLEANYPRVSLVAFVGLFSVYFLFRLSAHKNQ